MLNPALLVSGGHLREDKKKEGKCSSFSSGQHCMRGASFAPGNTQDICRFLSSPEFMCVPLHPSSFPSTQQLGVSGSQPVTLWRARQIQAQHGKHITSVSAWEHLALPGCEGPSVCLSDSEPTHTLLVYTGVVMAPQFLLLHRYWFIIQTINNLYNTKANRLNVIIKHRTIL